MGRRKKTAKAAKDVKNLSQTHGQAEEFTPTTLDQIWGDTGLWKYNTMELGEYNEQLQEMTKTDLQAHATKIGLIPVDSREMLTQRLVREFRRHVNSYEDRKEHRSLVRQIEKLEEEKKQMEDFFKDSNVSYDQMHEKGKELETLNNLLDKKLNRWMELDELKNKA